jgi:hypothetical protein
MCESLSEVAARLKVEAKRIGPCTHVILEIIHDKGAKPGGTVGYQAQPGLTWRNRRLPSPTRITLEEP